ncbi:hypothetical protein DUI87_04014 [Hirundo rustica rustica]|uniref:Uncharacterized protein n=1 Tax=Hirundo rustica rustica TaxID=333673 RepID=A0A3M0L621_HIRRU|nr:hypothetical protein DUI87_04014 [Hirundo rustica rustica]
MNSCRSNCMHSTMKGADKVIFQGMPFKRFLLTAFGVFETLLLADGWTVPQPKQNVWVTLANITNQETLCLSVASPDNLYSTCLVGLPMDVWPIAENTIRTMRGNSLKNEWIHMHH